jgi:glycerol kinase
VLKVDGGMAANDWMAQDIADITGLEVIRPDFVETTALGAAMLAAVGAGIHPSLDAAAAAMIGPERRFVPAMKPEVRERRIADWNAALAKV